jgi:hypothetical protein
MEKSHLNITSDIIINKDQKSIWQILTDINNWGRWNPSIDHAVMYGRLKEGTSFKCNSGKWEFDCEISKLELERYILFKGKTIGLTLVIAWQLEQASSGIKAIVSLKASGWMAGVFRKRLTEYSEYILHRWLESLKTQAERGMAIVDEYNADEESAARQGTVFTAPFSFLSDFKKSKKQKRGGIK